MHLLLASETHANLFGWYVGFVVTAIAIVIVVIEVQAILVLARNIGVLTLLIRLVQDIAQGVDGVVETLGQTARNTGESFLIADTAGQVDAVLAEGLNHHLFLTRVLSGSGKKAVPR